MVKNIFNCKELLVTITNSMLMCSWSWGNLQQLKEDDQQELQARALLSWTLSVLPVEALQAYRTDPISSNITVFSDREDFPHSCFAPSSLFEDTVQGTYQSTNPRLASEAGKATILLPSKTRQVMTTKILSLCPFQSLCWGTGKHAAHVCSHISDLFMPLQIVPISRPLLLYSPLFLVLPAQYSACEGARPQHLSGTVGNYPSLSEVALFLDMQALRGSTARGKPDSISLREHCG